MDPQLSTFLLWLGGILLIFLLFLLFRMAILWYVKIPERIKNQEEIIRLLKKIVGEKEVISDLVYKLKGEKPPAKDE
jgi:hypothetical protein